MTAAYSATIANWISKWGPSYLSHATNNYETLFKEGKLCGAEEVLAKSGTCECEISVDETRGTVKKEIVPEETNLILAYEKTSKKTSSVVEVFIVPKYCKQPLPTTTKVKDRGLFWTYKQPKVVKVEDTSKKEEQPAKDELVTFLEYLLPPAPSAPTMRTITVDCENSAKVVSKEEIDKTIRAIWNFAQKKTFGTERALLDFRDATLGLRKAYIRSEIRTAKNSVLWNYGKVAIIIGKAKEKLFSEYPMGRCRMMPYDMPISDGCEFYLKAPFQVESGYYSETLDSEENMILGPKEILDKYRQTFKKACVVNIEDLNDAELQLFKLSTTQGPS